MFENAPPNLPTPKEPEDIFGGKTSSPTPPRPPVPTSPPARPSGPTSLTSPPAPTAPPTLPPPPRPQPVLPASVPPARVALPPGATLQKPSRSWLKVFVAVLILAVLGGAAYFVVVKQNMFGLVGGIKAPEEEVAETQTPDVVVPTVPPPTRETVTPPPPPPPPRPEPVDSDGDGLTDEDELGLTTDPLRADTDDDGLLDNEEVRIYRSDPLNPDTDSDGFKDGDEVRNGYNPTGPGRLFQVPTE